MPQTLTRIEAFQSASPAASTTITILRPGRHETSYHDVSTASLRRLARLVDYACCTLCAEIRPWHTCLGWTAYFRPSS